MSTKPNDQRKRFIDAARDLECDDDPEAFRRRLKKLVEAPPPDESVPGRTKSKKRK